MIFYLILKVLNSEYIQHDKQLHNKFPVHVTCKEFATQFIDKMRLKDHKRLVHMGIRTESIRTANFVRIHKNANG